MFYQFIDRKFLRGKAPQWSSEARLFASEAKNRRKAPIYLLVFIKKENQVSVLFMYKLEMKQLAREEQPDRTEEANLSLIIDMQCILQNAE